MKEIQLSNSSLVAIVDDEDYEILSRWRWHVYRRQYDNAPIPRRSSRPRIRMHNLIMQPPDGLEVNHINFREDTTLPNKPIPSKPDPTRMERG